MVHANYKHKLHPPPRWVERSEGRVTLYRTKTSLLVQRLVTLSSPKARLSQRESEAEQPRPHWELPGHA